MQVYSFSLAWHRKNWNLLTFDATAQLIHALITSCLYFCNNILYNLPNKQIERLQRIQNQAARMLTRIPRRNHITTVWRELHWLRIHDRIIFKILVLCFVESKNHFHGWCFIWFIPTSNYFHSFLIIFESS